MLKIGKRVIGPHGSGVIVQVRRAVANPYIVSFSMLKTVPKDLAFGTFYTPERYPFRVTFDCGYTEVYSAEALKPETTKIPCKVAVCPHKKG